MDVTFKGELHLIPAGAGLVLRVEHHITKDQAALIAAHAKEALGADMRVLVLGRGVTAEALEG